MPRGRGFIPRWRGRGFVGHGGRFLSRDDDDVDTLFHAFQLWHGFQQLHNAVLALTFCHGGHFMQHMMELGKPITVKFFDHGIREVLCCLGRARYLSVLEEDEVHSVAGLLGDLVAYRAAGAGHLEFLAGIALLQRQTTTLPSLEEFAEAPEDQIQEAVVLHPFAEAAYTGLLLDVGRNPIIFPCAWLYRQGVLTPWSRNRRPVLQGDNWCGERGQQTVSSSSP